MSKADNLLAISKLVFELTVTSSITSDLDVLLEKLFFILRDYPKFNLEARGAVVLRNPRGFHFQVAQFGMEPAWNTNFRWPLNVFEDATSLSGTAIKTTLLNQQSISGETRQLLMLPLTVETRFFGYLILFAPLSYQPAETHLDFMIDLARAFSGMVQRTLSQEILHIRELELEDARTDALRSLGVASEYRDNETGWHIKRMTNFSLAIAKSYGLPDDQIELLNVAAPMHDVGKIGIADSVLLKPGKLTAEEFEVMKTHTTIGVTILQGNDTLIAAAREIAGSHHERWDGNGYPTGLAGDAIPVLARICTVADVFDALTSIRTYKKAWAVNEATDWIISESGKHFDPAIVLAFKAAIPEILRVRELYSDEIIDPRKTLSLPQLPSRPNSWVTWDDSLSIGIDTIDEHHRYLFDLINDLHEVVSNKRGARDVARLIKATDAYAKVHFRAEEQMLQHYGYDDIQKQKDQHHAFEDKIREFYEELHVNPLVAQFDVLSYLRDWLIHHICVEDAKLQKLVHA